MSTYKESNTAFLRRSRWTLLVCIVLTASSTSHAGKMNIVLRRWQHKAAIAASRPGHSFPTAAFRFAWTPIIEHALMRVANYYRSLRTTQAGRKAARRSPDVANRWVPNASFAAVAGRLDPRCATDEKW